MINKSLQLHTAREFVARLIVNGPMLIHHTKIKKCIYADIKCMYKY